MSSGSDKWKAATRAIHAGHYASDQQENSLAIYATSSYAFDDAQQAADTFSGDLDANVYSRFNNPSVAAFEERMAALEGGESCVATASGMSAIFGVFMAFLQAGDHLVMSRSVFGSTLNVGKNYLEKFGVEVSYLPLSDTEAWEQAIRPNTKMFYLETPANPTLELGDLSALSALARANDIRVVVDNVFCTPILQRPLEFGAHLVVHSATKYIDGQGRVLGGAVIGDMESVEGPMRTYMRNGGPTLSAFNAWVLYKSLETLSIRMRAHSDSAEAIAQALDELPASKGRVHYPGLTSHPQHGLAKRQMDRFGGILCLDLESRAQAHAFMDRLQLATITANLGDSKTLVTHPATTTHSRLSPEDRRAAGIGDGLVRFSIGLEEQEDILQDIVNALAG
uniref:O-succinylhomoserine sulfhydrylase n=1 Tax=Magnetococcus massalia (strain MO-1) TaxID=451514 RepID=A0A1S7LFT5_MAGMO|nr:O-succinylhomoserine sulfhydrylase [Candidatus Magnetococcus massalia]